MLCFVQNADFCGNDNLRTLPRVLFCEWPERRLSFGEDFPLQLSRDWLY